MGETPVLGQWLDTWRRLRVDRGPGRVQPETNGLAYGLFRRPRLFARSYGQMTQPVEVVLRHGNRRDPQRIAGQVTPCLAVQGLGDLWIDQ